ncbi:MAG: hypothetical protein ACXACU_06570 [Candidatus Hodarchaeales archaeon]|jgi:hypothetical protein
MKSQNIGPLGPELSGIWGVKPPSNYQLRLWQIFRISTLVIALLIFFKVIEQISLVPVAVFFISGVIVLVLDLYLRRFPVITIPLSQLDIFITISYLSLYKLYTQQAIIFEAVSYSIFPDLIDLILGIIFLIRIIIGIEIIRVTKPYENARIPLSKHPYESFQSFLTNLKLSSEEIADEFAEESVKSHLRSIFSSIFLAISILFLLLTPLWLILTNILNIYPYIILIPTILAVLLLLVYFSPNNSKISGLEKSEN